MNRLATVALSPLGGLYGVAMKVRRGFYRRGWLRVREVGAPVISVGNITLGGTGKTPLVEWVATKLAAENRQVCILTRGYGRLHPRQRVVVSNGSEILSDAAHAGDEALLLAERLKGHAAVISDADRVSAARWAIKHLGSGVLILDDGFQNLGLARNLNIVAVDATNPWGNRQLIPAGILREPLTQLSRADCIVLTRIEDSDQIEKLEREMSQLTKSPIFHSRTKIRSLRPINVAGENLSSEEVRSSRIAAFCGIGNPKSFFAQLQRDGYELVYTQKFRDHHAYDQSNIDRVVRESIAAGAQALLTTAKDEVKLRSLRFDPPCYAVDITIEIAEEEQFGTLIKESLRNKSKSEAGHKGSVRSPTSESSAG
jgi:tetraacyldisaccharide 4'-kinase